MIMAPQFAEVSQWWQRVALRTALQVLLQLGWAAAVYGSTTLQLFGVWNDADRDTYSHGWLVLAVVIWWILDISEGLSQLEVRVAPAGVLIHAIVGCLWLLASAAALQVLQLALLPILLWTLIWAVLGASVARWLLAPILFLYFAIPVWEAAIPVLQNLTVWTNRLLLVLTRVSATFDGNLIHLRSGSFEVSDGCSGLHFLIVGAAVATFFVQVHRARQGWRLVLLAVGIALVTNWLRVYLIVLAGYFTDMTHYLVQVSHYWFGWALFALAMVGFFFYAGRWPQDTPASPVPVDMIGWRIPAQGAVLVSLLALMFPGVLWITGRMAGAYLVEVSFVTPPGWSQASRTVTDWQPHFRGASFEIRESLQKEGVVVGVYRATYGALTQQAKPGGYGNSDRAFTVARTETGSASVAYGAEGVREVQFADATGRASLLWTTYFAGDRWFSAVRVAQAWAALERLRGRAACGVVALQVECAGNCTHERQLLAELLPALQRRH